MRRIEGTSPSATLTAPHEVKAGYRIAITRDAAPRVRDVTAAVGTCNGSTNAPASSFFASAEPVTPGGTGVRYFAVDARGILVSSPEPIANPLLLSPALTPVQ